MSQLTFPFIRERERELGRRIGLTEEQMDLAEHHGLLFPLLENCLLVKGKLALYGIS